MKRVEHDFYKIVSTQIKKFDCKDPKVVELIAIIDGYFLESEKRRRKLDIQISMLQETLKEEEA